MSRQRDGYSVLFVNKHIILVLYFNLLFKDKVLFSELWEAGFGVRQTFVFLYEFTLFINYQGAVTCETGPLYCW